MSKITTDCYTNMLVFVASNEQFSDTIVVYLQLIKKNKPTNYR